MFCSVAAGAGSVTESERETRQHPDGWSSSGGGAEGMHVRGARGTGDFSSLHAKKKKVFSCGSDRAWNSSATKTDHRWRCDIGVVMRQAQEGVLGRSELTFFFLKKSE